MPGVDQQFSLDTGDTFAFMRTFAATDEMARPFDDAMSVLAQHMLEAGVAADGHGDAPALQRVMGYLGSTAGLEHAAELEVRGKLDDQERKVREFMGDLANIAMNAAPVNPVTLSGKVLWQVAQFEGGKLIDDYVDGGETRTDQLEDRRRQASLARTYVIAGELLAHGYPMTAAPHDTADKWAREHGVDPARARFTDSGGQLLPPNQIAGDRNRLAAYDAWMEANGRGGEHENAFGQKTVNLANQVQGAFGRTVDRYGPERD